RHDTTVRTLIERLFRLDAVRTVEVNRGRATVEILYDATAVAPAVALTQFSKALGAESMSQTETALGRGLAQIPGLVRRVERGGRPPKTRALAVSTADIPARSGRRGPNKKTLAVIGQENPRVVAEEWLVEYVPAPAKAIASARLVPTYNGAGNLGGPRSAPIKREPGRKRRSRGNSLGDSLRRAVNLTAAGGCFAMSIVGVMTPGIPTVPFVLATSYFLARSSPKLHERFRRSRLFGPIVCDWEEYGGLRLGTKFRLVAITLVLVGVTIAIADLSPPLVIVMGVMGVITFAIVFRLPTVAETAPARRIIVATA
ncbi:MAG TPA: YbaN family protein, partial [Pirellulales bacterium]|nr:YbaN family protein [Pirellulales bacterium]